MGYLDLPGFRAETLMPGSDVDALDVRHPGWIAGQLESWSRQIDARLRKRYAVPFVAPYPIAVQGWLARIVTLRCYLKRGVDPNDAQFEVIKEDADNAVAEIKEAADAETGLYDLPLIEGSSASGISKGGPRSYSEASPYVGFDVQERVGRGEDRNGEGTYG